MEHTFVENMAVYYVRQRHLLLMHSPWSSESQKGIINYDNLEHIYLPINCSGLLYFDVFYIFASQFPFFNAKSKNIVKTDFLSKRKHSFCTCSRGNVKSVSTWLCVAHVSLLSQKYTLSFQFIFTSFVYLEFRVKVTPF